MRSFVTLLLCGLGAGAATTWSSPARTQGIEASAEDKETARVVFGLGLALLEKGDTRGALAKFLFADQLYRTPITALQLGKTHLALGELVLAHQAFAGVAAIPLRPSESEKSAAARVEAARLTLEVRARLAELLLTVAGVDPDEPLTMTIDGRVTSSLVGPHILDPGEHEIVLRTTTLPARVVTLKVRLGEGEHRATMMLVPPPPPPPATEASAPPPPEWQPKFLVVPKAGALLTGSMTSTGGGGMCVGSCPLPGLDSLDRSGSGFGLDGLFAIGRHLRLGVSTWFVPRTRLQTLHLGSDWMTGVAVEGVITFSKEISLFGRITPGVMVLFPSDEAGVGPGCTVCFIDKGAHSSLALALDAGLTFHVTRGFGVRTELMYQLFGGMNVAGPQKTSTFQLDGVTLQGQRLWLMLGTELGI